MVVCIAVAVAGTEPALLIRETVTARKAVRKVRSPHSLAQLLCSGEGRFSGAAPACHRVGSQSFIATANILYAHILEPSVAR